MNILALDLSLTSTGYCLTAIWGRIRSHKHDEMERLAFIRDEILKLAADADLVVIEGYSFGSKGRAIIDIGQLGGVVRLELFERGIPFVNVAPTSLKKYATGKGNANKNAVLAEAIKRLKYAGDNSDEADALWLSEMAADAYGLREPRVPLLNREALKKVVWPTIAEVQETA